MKSMFLRLPAVCMLMMASLWLIAQENVPAKTIDEFPTDAVWMNLDYKLGMSNLHEKIAIVVIGEERCVECSYYLRELEA
ncbi:MAG: hypothetical protein ACKO7B_13435, partial [Flavobacteriales bacterium]